MQKISRILQNRLLFASLKSSDINLTTLSLTSAVTITFQYPRRHLHPYSLLLPLFCLLTGFSQHLAPVRKRHLLRWRVLRGDWCVDSCFCSDPSSFKSENSLCKICWTFFWVVWWSIFVSNSVWIPPPWSLLSLFESAGHLSYPTLFSVSLILNRGTWLDFCRILASIWCWLQFFSNCLNSY